MNTAIGVIRRQQSTAQQAPGGTASAAAFWETMTGRYGSSAVTVSGADLALAWDPVSEVHHHHQSVRAWTLPAISFGQQNTFVAAPREFAVESAGARYGDAEASALFGRLFSRHTRVAAFDGPGGTAPDGQTAERQRAAAAQAPESVERVLSRPRAAAEPAVTIERAMPLPSSAGDTGWGTPVPFAESAKPVSLPAPEIRRVADQVMREIDNRLTARRERTGRR